MMNNESEQYETINPVKLANELERRYRQYLQTTFFFRDPELRASFADALSKGYLSRGPYLEATPVFQKGMSPASLFPTLLAGDVNKEFLKSIDGNRELYLHQQEAIKKVHAGNNIIIATGTGSGKTEAFLYPILLQLYQEYKNGNLCPGVRALILYPMNALANDQRERLGRISENLNKNSSDFNFTFGQYIGETPEDEKDTRRNAKEHLSNKFYGELVFRKEMRETPPHILLTNYSMLEYLLIRPDDSKLFDNGRAKWWTFLILDEAHQYRGAKGIEMAMLIRRLKQRLKEGGRENPFRCIATSATIAGGEEDKPEVAKFAKNLFGEEFTESDVIFGTPVEVTDKANYKLSPTDYNVILNYLNNDTNENRNQLNDIAKHLYLKLDHSESISCWCGKILSRDERAIQLQKLITNEPMELKVVSNQLFPELSEQDRVSATKNLIEALQLARANFSTNSTNPLLSVRYHFFLRSLEGAFVSYLPIKKIYLDRRHIEGAALFEVALCRNCGQHYFVGKKINGRLVEAILDPSNEEFGASFYRPIDIDEDFSDDDKNNNQKKKKFNLCLICGMIDRNNLQCSHKNSIKVIEEETPKDEDRANQISQCSVCGYNASGKDPVRELIHGHDGPNAVIATTLYQHLPKNRKKILAFADNRQEAAFFAWYLESSYKDILNRNLVLKVIYGLSPHTNEGISLSDLASELKNIYRKMGIYPESDTELTLKKKSWLDVYREFLTDETRLSLEGVGLIKWKIKFPQQFEVPEILTKFPWSLSKQEALDLILIQLNFMRIDRAVELNTEPGIYINWKDLNLQANQTRVRIGLPSKQKNVKSWDSKNGRRGRFLTKLLLKINPGLSPINAKQHSEEALREIWEYFRELDRKSSSNSKFLISLDDGKRLNPNWSRIFPILEEDKLYQCNSCGKLQTINIKGICTQNRCGGELIEIKAKNLALNHYRMLYEDNLPGMLRVEEHTAQLSPEKAKQFQKEFSNDKIHVLSSSTTFELGVDLGTLDLVFLRNIPPEAFNYAQRVGRTGRRIGSPGFAISYCRRNPHDIYHFNDPSKIIKGKIRPPILTIANEKIILRHITAFVLSLFFQHNRHRFYDQNNKSRVKQLFVDFNNPIAVLDSMNFIKIHRTEMVKSLKNIVPDNLHNKIGLNNSSWIQKIAGIDESNEDSIFRISELEIANDFRNAKELEITSREKGDYKTAEWAKKRAKTIAEEDVLSFLSRKAIIPKYGFPVDVVELDVHRLENSSSRDVLLQRDLSIAISEFAPTSKIIANKLEWKSYALKKVAEKAWEVRKYKKCKEHNFFTSWNVGTEQKEKDCCRLIESKYIIPRFGFVAKREKPKQPTRRSEKMFTTKPYFSGLTSDSRGYVDFEFLKFWKASPGKMIVLCEGKRNRGFYICSDCGAGFTSLEKPPHKNPNGYACNGKLDNVSLGHEFITDVVKFQFLLGNYQLKINPVWLAYSLAYAILVGAAETLEVPYNDLNVTVGYSIKENALPPIILYDNVPGGAGLVARLENKEILFSCLKEAKIKVNGNCGCDSSCYGCLRSYKNQFVHQYLSRQDAFDFLSHQLSLFDKYLS